MPSVEPPPLPLAPFDGDPEMARGEFSALARRLLGEDDAPDALRAAACALYALFQDIGGRPHEVTGAAAFGWQRETLLPTGNAINPYSAATCLLDFARTRAFALGVREAIAAARERFPGDRIELLYAGTGPFAPLALLQTPFYGADEIRFTLIDVHDAALACQRQIVSVLGLERYVAETVRADAADWAPPDGRKFHVAVAEVMQRALIREPQVGVTMAVAKHLRPDGFLVPERIELSLCLLDPAAERARARAGIDRIPEYFQLSGDSFPDAARDTQGGAGASGGRLLIAQPFALTRSVGTDHEISADGRIALAPVRLPDVIPPGQALRVLTRITTFGETVLGDYDSGLTFPEPLPEEPELTPGGDCDLWYEMRYPPGLRLRPTCQTAG